MKKTEIYNFLTSDSIKDEKKFNEFLTDLKNDIAIETAQEKSGSRKQRLQKCINLITKSKAHKMRPTFQKYVMIDNRQTVILDSGIALACLVEKDFIVGLEEATETDNFPNVNRLLSDFKNKNLANKVTVNAFDLHMKLKLKEVALELDCNEYSKIYFNPESLNNLLYLLNIDNQKEFTIYFDTPLKPAIIKCDNGSYGIICPINPNYNNKN